MPATPASRQTARQRTPPPACGTTRIAPYSLGSHRSRLIEVLREGHHDVALSPAEFVKLATWIDTNGQYYGSYFGLRNLRHRDQPGFREPPTLRSAYGIRPDQISDGPLEPVLAELVAHWPFDEPDGATVHDGSGSDHHGQVVGAQRIEGRSGRALKFSGHGDFVHVGDLPGDFTTVSIAFWVKPESLPSRRNAIRFCDDWSEHDLHLSLFQNGAANVAVHRVFGHKATVRLTGVRLGDYHVWEEQPGANFHGALDDFPIYRGLLTEGQIRTLVNE